MSRAPDDTTSPTDAARLAALEARLERVLSEQETMLAVLGHELRNPLGAIRTAVMLQRRLDPGDARFARCQTIIESQTDAIIELVDVLRDVSRLARGRLELERAPVELAGLLRELVAERGEALAARGVAVELAPSSAAVTVEGEAQRLREVFGALLERVAAAAPANPDTRVGLALEVTHGGEVVVRVHDTAPGLSPEVVATLFEPFERADRIDPRLALLLARARGLVELHGGRLEVDESDAGGTTLAVRLPQRAA